MMLLHVTASTQPARVAEMGNLHKGMQPGPDPDFQFLIPSLISNLIWNGHRECDGNRLTNQSAEVWQ